MRGRTFSIAVAMASMSTIALELVLTRVYSVTMYYHFAFLAISVALLGLAAAGTTIFLLPRVFRKERTAKLAAGFMIGFAITSIWAAWAAITNPISLTDWTANLGKLVHIYVAAAAPLVCSGFAISLAIASAGDNIGKIYMFDLVGAGVGCIFVIPAIGWFGGPGAIFVVAALGAVSALLFAISDRPGFPRWRIAAGIAVVCAGVLGGFGMTEGEAKRFGIVRNPGKFLGNRAVLFEKWNSFSQITVAPAGDKDHLWIFIDGDAATRLWKREAIDAPVDPRKRIAEIRVAGIVYALRPQGPAAIIGPGGGTDVLSALKAGVPRVYGVEINPIIVDDVMRGKFAEVSSNLYRDPRVTIVNDEGRSFLRRSSERYSSIQATLVDTWAASSSGAFTLSENNLYTIEAFDEFLDALAPGGVLSITRWYDPKRPAEYVRLLAIARATLEGRGIAPEQVRDHFLIATDGELRTTLMVSRDPFPAADIEKFVSLVMKERVFPLFIPGRAVDKQLAAVLEKPDLDAHLATLPYDASPTTDDRPFFFYHQRFTDAIRSFKTTDGQLNNVGMVVLLLLLAMSVLAALLFVLLPLFVFRRKDLATDRRRKLRVIGYFACLGLGFILVELGFMQQFVLFLGHPVYSLGVVLAGLLIASGIGAGLTPRLNRRFGELRAKWIAVAALIVLLAFYGLALSSIFNALIGLALPVRIAIAGLFAMLPGLIMGTFVPNGVRAADAIAPGMVAWGWGLNGATSVVGSALAVMLSMNIGFRLVLVIGAAIYLLAGVLLPRPADDQSART